MTKLFLIIIIASANLFAQSGLSVGVRTSYNWFNQKEMKGLLHNSSKEISAETGVDAKVTDNFPDFAGLGLSLNYSFSETFEAGLFLDYSSTGGRVHYSDYSGSVSDEYNISSYSVGPEICGIKEAMGLNWRYSIRLHLIFSNMTNIYKLKAGELYDRTKLQYSSTSFGIEPAFGPSIKVSGFDFAIQVSYMIAALDEFGRTFNSNLKLKDSEGNKIRNNLSGLRTSIQINYEL